MREMPANKRKRSPTPPKQRLSTTGVVLPDKWTDKVLPKSTFPSVAYLMRRGFKVAVAFAIRAALVVACTDAKLGAWAVENEPRLLTIKDCPCDEETRQGGLQTEEGPRGKVGAVLRRAGRNK